MAKSDLLSRMLSGALSESELDALVTRWEWFSAPRIVRRRFTGRPDSRLDIAAPWRDESPLCAAPVDGDALTTLSDAERIDLFLVEEHLRIVAEEGEPAPGEEVRMAPELDDDEELVSERLAEIYLAQGLRGQAAEIYRKLSLLNPEKSVYFAELIRKIENNN